MSFLTIELSIYITCNVITHPFCENAGACEGSLACSTCHVIVMVILVTFMIECICQNCGWYPEHYLYSVFFFLSKGH